MARPKRGERRARSRPAPRARGASRPSGRPSRFVLRAATLADLPLLVRHRRGMWRTIGRGTPRELAAHDRQYRSWVRREWAAGRFAAFVALGPDDRPLGSGAVWLTPSQPRPGRLATKEMPYILSMFTEDDARGRGVASRIVRALVDWSRARGYPRVTLHASKMGRAIYERFGFRSTNEMRLDLRRRSRARGRRARPGRRA